MALTVDRTASTRASARWRAIATRDGTTTHVSEGPDGKAVGALSIEAGKIHPTRMKTTEIVQELCEWQTFENV